MLRETGTLLESQGANPFRAHAYSHAGEIVSAFPTQLSSIITERGGDALQELPGIGKSLAKSVERLVMTGRLPLLERLRGEAEPETVLATIGGIGPVLSKRLKDELGVTTLPDLEKALSGGKLAKLPGFGEKRVRMIRESLSGRLRKEEDATVRGRDALGDTRQISDEPSVAILLDIDYEYRHRVKRGDLPRITPKKFNPTREAWLPILHTQRDGQHYTALYSNTARAHSLGVTRDWVVMYRDERDGDGQWTAITSGYGALRGKRIIRGREVECREYYLGDGGKASLGGH
jgi:predicted flap endonuclease-1-like 5' DNA nuclease